MVSGWWLAVSSHHLPVTTYYLLLTTHYSLLTTHQLFRLLMRRVLPTEPAVLAELQPFRRLLLVLRRAVVPALTIAARHMDDVSHC